MSEPIIIQVKAVVVDTHRMTLYKTDGSTYEIPQGDPRLQPILEQVLPLVTNQKVAEVIVGNAPTPTTHFSDVEEKTGGLIKFFRVAKSKLKDFFNSQEPEDVPFVEPIAAGQIEEPPHHSLAASNKQPYAPKLDIVPEKTAAAVEEIMKHAIPTSSKDFADTSTSHRLKDDGVDTVIAVVGNKVVPDAHKLQAQIKESAKPEGSAVGLQKFLERCAAVNAKRSHSVQDLMKFMQRGDLPIADDGSIIIYKVLKKGDAGHTGFDYIDCHSKRVPQRVGSYVWMSEKLVDHNRRYECSSGLHVARRGYINGFNGDVCVLAKVNPEDVIAVPEHDANKMRVAGYHILFELSAEAYSLLRSNKPMTSIPECQAILGKALSGNHIVVTNRVEITGAKGTGIKIEELFTNEAPESDEPGPEQTAPERMAEALDTDDDEELEEVLLNAPKVDPKALAKKVSADKAQQPLSRAQQAQKLYETFAQATGEDKVKAAEVVLLFKKRAKVSWISLGLSIKEVEELTTAKAKEAAAASLPKSKPAAKPFSVSKKAKTVKAAKAKVAKPVKEKPVEQRIMEAEQSAVVAQAKKEAKGKPANDERQQLSLKLINGDKQAARTLLALKKDKKKGWVALGLPANTGDLIEKLLK